MMEIFFYILGSAITLVISFVFFKKAAGSLSLFKPNMISYIFYFNLVLEMFIGSILVLLKIDDHYMFYRIHDNTRFLGWLVINYTLITLPLGMLIAKWLFVGKKSMRMLLNSYVTRPIDTQYLGKGLKYSIWCFTFISGLACLYTFIKIGYIPILKVFQGGDLATLRITVSGNFSGNEYVKNLLALGLMPALSYMWCFYYLQRKSLINLFMFFVTLVFAINILYYNFAKAPVLWYILSYVFVYYYAFGKINKKYVIFSTGLVFIILVFFYSLNGEKVESFVSYNNGPIGRIILSQAGGLYYMLQIFPGTFDHIGFSSLSNAISNLFSLEYSERAARIVMERFNPSGVQEGTAGVMNSLFIGEAWVNFGLTGVLVAPIWVGICIQCLYMFFLKLPKSPLFIAFFVSFSFGGSITGGFNDYFYNPSLFVKLVILLSILFLAFLLNNASKNKK